MEARNGRSLVVALDGPAGVGKSSVASRIAARFGLTYVETGAIYRAVALLARERGMSEDDEAGLAALAATLDVGFLSGGDGNRVLVGGEDRTDALRAPEIGRMASVVSAHPAVRAALLELQRAWARRGGIIAEGRDIGTVVFPEACCKIFLTATPEERARRRHRQLRERGVDADYDAVLAEVNARDLGDSTRAAAPLRPAEDARVLDCTELELDAVVDAIAALVEDCIAEGCVGETPSTGPHRAGFVALVGRPNTGKSTLLNHLLGTKVAIVSPKPQTTRHRILGILTRPGFQVAFVDTPGIHEGGRELNRVMVRAALDILSEVDLVCLLVDVVRFLKEPASEEARVRAIIAAVSSAGTRLVLVLNKIDRVRKPALLPLMDRLRDTGALAMVPVSATTGDGCGELLRTLVQALPEGDRMFPDEQVTDRSDGFMVTELVREKVLHLTRQEVPHAVAVTLDRIVDVSSPRSMRVITATIHVERDSQKGIIIGEKGQMLRRIGTAARQEMEARFGCRVTLELHVRVEKDWSRHARGLRKVEYQP